MLDFSKCFLFTSIRTCLSLSVIQLRKRNVLDSAGQKSKRHQKHLAVFLQSLRAKLHPPPSLSRLGKRHSLRLSTRDLCATTSQDPLFLRTTLNSTNIQWTASHLHILENWFNSLSHLRETSPYIQYFNTIQAIKSNCGIKCSSPIAAIALESETERARGCVFSSLKISSTMKCHFTINCRVLGTTSLLQESSLAKAESWLDENSQIAHTTKVFRPDSSLDKSSLEMWWNKGENWPLR